MENEIKCPKCGTTFKIDEKYYDSIIKQVRDKTFEEQLNEREKTILNEKENEIKLLKLELEGKNKEQINQLSLRIKDLEKIIEQNDNKTKLEMNKITSEKDKNITELENKLELNEKEFKLKEKNIN